MRFRKTEKEKPQVDSESLKTHRSKLHLLAAIFTGSTVISLGLTTVGLRVLSHAERSKTLLKFSLKEYVESLKNIVKPSLDFGQDGWFLTAKADMVSVHQTSPENNDDTKLDVLGLVKDNLPSYSGDYQHSYTIAGGQMRKHVLRLSADDKVVDDENNQVVFIGNYQGLVNPTELSTVSMDSLPTLLTTDLADKFTANRVVIPFDQIDSDRKKQIESFRLTDMAKRWLPDLNSNMIFLATDIGQPSGELLEQFKNFQDASPTSIASLDESIDILSMVYLAKTAMALPIAASQSYILANLQGNDRPTMTRRRFLQFAAGAGVVGGHLAMGNQTGRFVLDINALRKQAEMLAWIMHLPFQVSSQAPENFIGRVNSFLAKTEQQIPALAYFLFVRDLVTTYKEMFILQSGVYTSEMQPESLSLWGNLHDTKIGLYALSQNELLGYISQAITRFPNLFRTCFGGSEIDQDASDQFRYLGPHELYTACAYRAEANGVNKEWQIRAVEAWQFSELKAIVESALAR